MKSRLLIIISMVIFGTIGVFRRNIDVSSGELALFRAVLAAIMIGLFLIITGKKVSFSEIKKDLLLLTVSGIAMGLNWILLFEAYNYTTISLATLSYYFAPIIVTLTSVFLFREKLSVSQIICFTASTIGIVMITGIGDKSGGNRHFYGILLGLSAAVLYASVVLINKKIKGAHGIVRTFLQFIAAIVVLLPYVLFNGGIHLGGLTSSGWAGLLTVGIVHTGITYCMYFTSLKSLPGQEAAILSYVDPLVAVILSLTVLKEPMNIWQIVGGTLILGFTLINEINIDFKSKRKKGDAICRKNHI